MLLLLCPYLVIYIYIYIYIPKLSQYSDPSRRRHPSISVDHMLLGSMTDESFSNIVVVSPCRPTVLNGIDPSQNLIVLNVNAQTPLKLIATNYSVWRLQFTSLLFGYDLLGFVNGSKPCPLAMITLPDAVSPSPNLDHILWLRQDQFLLNAIVGSVSATLVRFISTFATSRVA